MVAFMSVMIIRNTDCSHCHLAIIIVACEPRVFPLASGLPDPLFLRCAKKNRVAEKDPLTVCEWCTALIFSVGVNS